VNLVGGQDELVFDGASMIFGLDGALLARAPQFEEAVLICDIDIQAAYRKRLLDPRGFVEGPPATVVTVSDTSIASASDAPAVVAALGPVEEVYAALVTGTHDYVVKNGFSDVVIGLSGGVDSSLVASVAVDALGADKVHGVLMPSRYSSPGSLEDAHPDRGRPRRLPRTSRAFLPRARRRLGGGEHSEPCPRDTPHGAVQQARLAGAAHR
jgi:NAD+ synthase (glutamine-hydrolysing)